MDSKTRKHFLLGITGGVAAYKAAELVRKLVQDGHGVQVVMTEAATRFIAPVTLQALSGRAVFTDLWDSRVPNNMAHIDLVRAADAILVAPASADFLAKLAHGLADDLLSTLCLARDCPLLVAPAMNRQMWQQPATARNVEQLVRDGVRVLGPDSGDQACGETGVGRMLEPEELAAALRGSLGPGLLQGTRVLITAGPTFEPIDAVRGITNSSTGKMGYAVAAAAVDMGARVTLVSGPVALRPPPGLDLVRVNTAAQMYQAVMARSAECDLFVAVAAVADYTPARPSAVKIKKTRAPLTVELVPTEDILAEVARLPHGPFCVGFAAESNELEHYAQNKRLAKGIPLIAANLVQDAMGADASSLILYDDTGRHPLEHAPKRVLAERLLIHAHGLAVARHPDPAAGEPLWKRSTSA